MRNSIFLLLRKGDRLNFQLKYFNIELESRVISKDTEKRFEVLHKVGEEMGGKISYIKNLL